MADGATMRLDGAAELDRALRGLEAKVGRAISRQALRAGGNVILPAAKANASSMVGGAMGAAIAKSLKLRTATGDHRRRGVYLNIETRAEDNPAFVATSAAGTRNFIPAAIEYGHAAPGDAGGVKVVPAIPFGRSAFEQEKVNAVNAAMQVLRTEIPRAARAT